MGRARRSDLSLPKRLYVRRGKYFYVAPGGSWINLGPDREAAIESYIKATGVVPVIAIPNDFLLQLYKRAESGALDRGIPFELRLEEITAIWDRSRGRCEVTGAKFHLGKISGWARRPLAPSIDRIDSSGPYSQQNCRIVCVAVNVAFGEWGEAVFSALARGYIARKAGIILDIPVNIGQPVANMSEFPVSKRPR